MMYGRSVGAMRTCLVLFFGAVLLLGALFLMYKKVNGSEAGSTSADTSEKAGLRARLSTMQYYVTQEDGTEPAYKNEYWDTYAEGIYVDVVSGEALFSSTDKFDSKTGWPSFTKAITDKAVTFATDHLLGIPRTEVRSAQADSHLGHIFDDGPVDRGGKRYCINSAALRFVAKVDMKKEGYGEYLSLF